MKKVMISGHFDPFHDMHLDYIEQAATLGDYLICVVSSDKQLRKKKGIVHIPEENRRWIIDLILIGLGIEHKVLINTFDSNTMCVAEALKELKPDIFCRGGDKSEENFPPEEKQVCMDYDIRVWYSVFKIDRHGTRMEL